MRAWLFVVLVGCVGEPAAEHGLHVDVICNCPAPPRTDVTERFTSDGVTDALFLADVPDPATLVVTVLQDGLTTLLHEDDPATGRGEWVWDAAANAVVLVKYVPEAGVTLFVDYEPLNDRDDVPDGLGDGCRC